MANVRSEWVKKRLARLRSASSSGQAGPSGNGAGLNVSQMHYARQGVITEEMENVARREKVDAEFVRAEVARGRAIIPANLHHASLEPMTIGANFTCTPNVNNGNSPGSPNIEEELKKLH